MFDEFNLTENNHNLVILKNLTPILEDKVNRLINNHTKNGFAVISGCRSNRDGLSKEETRKVNIQKTGELKNDLKKMGWTYTVVYGGGFKEKGAEDNSPIKYKFDEISFVVYNYNRKNKDASLFDDMKKLTAKYEQDDFYYQESDGKAYWYDKNGNKDATFSKMVKNDDSQPFFTGFGSSKLSKKIKKNYIESGKVGNKKAFEHRYSGIMEAINPPPATYSERIIRSGSGEVFIDSYNVLTENEQLELLNSFFNY